MSTPMRKPTPRLRNSQARRSRSFGGCVTCRSRRVKCDEGRPECSMCKVLGVECGGYNKDIFFDFEDPSMGVVRFRRPLLTDRERKSMSDKILQDVPPNMASRHLSQIEEESENSVSDFQISLGPFGVFRITQQVCQDSEPGLWEPNESDVEHSTHAISERGRDCQISTELGDDVEFVIPPTDIQAVMVRQTTPPRLELSRSIGRVSPCPDWLGLLDDLPMIDYTDTQRSEGLGSWDCMVIDLRFPVQGYLPLFSQPSDSQNKSLENPPLFPSSHLDTVPYPIQNSVPDDAVFKTPWHVLFLPHVKSCLAALTLGEKIDHASMCAFYGTLSISAWSLGGIYGSNKWLDQGKVYYEKASRHFRMMLDSAYDIPKTAKYKSILIALLTMVQLCILSGDKDEAEYYFLETERFIRLRGLNKRKSRKVRLLHHCYVFERLSHESTFTENNLNLDHRNRVRESIEASGAREYSQDNLSFRLTTWSNLDQDMLKEKGQVEGENDLHLQHPGIWSATLYPEIFGVPELHLFMLSLVIRLGREKDDSASSGLNLGEFMIRAKVVERWIKQLHALRQSIWMVEAPVDQEQQQSVKLLNSLSETMQHALAVYFYRRIYDLDLEMLDKHVRGVRDRLLEFDDSDAGMGYGSLRLIWPAFIAACETDDFSIRGSFLKWFDDSAKQSGLRIFVETKERIERVWSARDEKDRDFTL
ncbi:transcription factor ARG81 [Fusarium heterosporum]|uniref:Transcription factor ARG81 n=1 Tax=Fusarium heterosporum TaxID=42747 RepID=A0A8H5T7P6_FUSHE|nr:transcription factor ARG81 [Fusarium heterosporum]